MRTPNPTRSAIRDLQQAISFDGVRQDGPRHERADALADILIDGIAAGAFTLTTAFDAARVAKLMVEIARLDRGQATSIQGREIPMTSEERLARFRELRSTIDVGETPPALSA